MGKSQPQLPIQNINNQNQNQNHHSNNGFSCFAKTISRLFSFKCVFILLLTLAVSLSAIFSLFHFHHQQIGFDAKDSIKNSAKVQAYFRLEKPVSFLIPQITRLEYDINDEIGVPGAQIFILSMHKSGASNQTDVVFGVLSKPMNYPINPVSLSVLRSSLVELFTKHSNLTLTKSIFGMPSSFDILKFSGGITIIPTPSPPVIMLPQVLFNFTLPNSLREIEDNFLELKEQLKSGLQLMPYESVFVQVTNKEGSTRDPPVTVQASIISTLGGLDSQRLKELAHNINGSQAKNLGLDNSVFGKVKGVKLSSYMYHTLDAPTPSPAPSPDAHMGPTISPSPASFDQSSPPVSNSPSPEMDPSCGVSIMSPGPSPMSDPSSHALPPHASPFGSGTPPDLSPLPAVSYGSRPHQENGYHKGLAPSPLLVLPSSSSSEKCVFYRTIWLFFFILMTLHIL
uniref:uncharacterized protein LOC122600036 n=1 Tax=Erigeron canadensis TaxID=72917 RepID=UPI001CB8F3E6|nr:uncharacterized protein LOC122600036 [Erigeron canadensis]